MCRSSWLSTVLDQEMLETMRGLTIAPRTTADEDLPVKSGSEVAEELGGRYLLHYLLRKQARQFRDGSDAKHYLTPTSYAPIDATSWLALASASRQRQYVMLLDPAKVDRVLGPRWTRLGRGIEYVLPQGFTSEAIVGGWELQIR